VGGKQPNSRPRRRAPTIDDVAARAGVSKSAVSFALNDRPGLAADTRSRILSAADELGWEPSTRARALSQSRAYALGLVLTRDPALLGTDPFFPAFIAGVETELSALEHALLLQVVGDDPSAESGRYERLAKSGRVDGVFLTDLRFDDPRVALCLELGLPAVTIGRPDQPSPFPAVCIDDRAGVAAAVHHLAELGHERIAHVAGRQSLLHGARRRHAWESAMRELGLEPALLEIADFTAASGAAATRALLGAADPTTAIVYANDVMAIAGLAVANDLGLTLPDQLSIVGYDDSELAAHVHPSLTSVRSDAVGWGRAATRVLLDSLDTPQADVDLAPASLVVRASTAGPADPPRNRKVP
jgi:LacI family repressor for deo operon, udp, cdd, tsx, nupC, and nupG